MTKYELTHNNIMEIVEACGGNVDLLPKTMRNLMYKEINTIEELEEYPFKNHYPFLLRQEEHPLLHQYLVDYLFDKTEYYSKHQQIKLKGVIEFLTEVDWDNGLREAFKDTSYFEHLEQFPEDYEITDETIQAILVNIRNDIYKELISSKFGSMRYDW